MTAVFFVTLSISPQSSPSTRLILPIMLLPPNRLRHVVNIFARVAPHRYIIVRVGGVGGWRGQESLLVRAIRPFCERKHTLVVAVDFLHAVQGEIKIAKRSRRRDSSYVRRAMKRHHWSSFSYSAALAGLGPSLRMGILMPCAAKHLLSGVLSMTPGNFFALYT